MKSYTIFYYEYTYMYYIISNQYIYKPLRAGVRKRGNTLCSFLKCVEDGFYTIALLYGLNSTLKLCQLERCIGVYS